MISKKVFLVANSCWYLYNFRLPLLDKLRNEGYLVELVATQDDYTELLEAKHFIVHKWKLSRSSVNPFKEVYSIINLIKIYNKHKPILVHHFTIKACLYGTIAARFSGITRIINAITGLGHVFISTGKRNRFLSLVLRPFYRIVFTNWNSIVVFQNADDQEKLIKMGIVGTQSSRLIRGSGVDTEYFKPDSNKVNENNNFKLLFPSRLIKQKGIEETLKACRSLWNEGYHFQLFLAGDLDVGNRSTLLKSDLDDLQNERLINLLGHVNDMRSIYNEVDAVILPSWREGLSRALLESASMKLAIITTDVPGCRDIVEHGRTGLLVPLKDTNSLKLAIKLLYHNPRLVKSFGVKAREKVINEFQVSLVNQNTIKQYSQLLNG